MVNFTGDPFGGLPPYLYDSVNVANSRIDPSTVHIKGTGLNDFFARYLLQRAMSVLEFKIPETWDRGYFLYILYCWGWIAIFKTAKFGVIPQQCGLSGYNIFYQPSRVVIANPLLPDVKKLKIGKDAALIRLQPNYSSILDLVGFYANMMALTAEAAGVNILNSKFAYVFGAKNKAAAESFKKMFDDIASGEPAVVIDKSLYNEDGSRAWDTFTQNLGSNYIAGDLLNDLRSWEERFDTEIGIPNANTKKRERLITDEVNSNNFETRSRVDLWIDTIRAGMKTANDLFPGLNLSVDWREDLREDDSGVITE